VNIELSTLLIFCGLILFLAGLSHRILAVSQWDLAAFKQFNAISQNNAQIVFFRVLWPIGTTPFTIITLLSLFLYDWRKGLLAGLSIFCATFIERIIKLNMKRIRPFEDLPDIAIHQPRRPNDPSFPSGDSLRVWFLAAVLPVVFGLAWYYILVVCFLALLISLGRIAMGVHYPLDVLSGAGLGLIAAGICLLILYH
jgi:membrane-associated phospholipid phosphatase